MNNERTVVLENVSGQPVGLKDTQNRTYSFGVGGKIRISEMSLQDILDYPASKIIFNEGMMKISNISIEGLYKMGLTENEIKTYLGDEYDAIVIAETIEEEPKEEEIIKIEEPKIEEPKVEEKIEEKVEAPAVKAPAKKPATRKTTTRKRKTSSTKTK